ncbi:MAG: carboxymuconolactone decarboxylase family protein [Candidatus Tumulicola sp.]
MSDVWDPLNARPQIARTLARHIAALDEGTVPRRTKELCALMVAWLNACERCAQAHSATAMRLGVDRVALEELGDFARSDRFSPSERAALSAAVALTREPRALPEPVRAALELHYDAGEIVEIVAGIGLYNYVTRANNALRPRTPTA